MGDFVMRGLAMLGLNQKHEKPGRLKSAQKICRMKNDKILGFTTGGVRIRF
jgi:hypothetical protein